MIDGIWPPTCVVCGERGAWVCAVCRAVLPLAGPGNCARCGGPVCACTDLPNELIALRSVGPHAGWLQDTVHAIKYQGERARIASLIDPMAACLADLLRYEAEALIVPVPLHPRRERQRGFNQSALLARAAAQRLGVVAMPEALVRRRQTRQQAQLTAEERRANVALAFQADASLVTARPVILIDDVFTTGSTLAACAGALHDAGSAGVVAVTVTRATWDASTWAGTAGAGGIGTAPQSNGAL